MTDRLTRLADAVERVVRRADALVNSPRLTDHEYENLTSGQRRAVYDWRSEEGHPKINDHLAKGGGSKRIAESAKHLTNMIESHRANKDLTLYRGVNATDEHLKSLHEAHKTGTPITLSRGISAFSGDKEHAAPYDYVPRSHSVIFQAHVPKGSRVLNVASASDDRKTLPGGDIDDEHIMHHGAKFKVHSIEHVKQRSNGWDTSHHLVKVSALDAGKAT